VDKPKIRCDRSESSAEIPIDGGDSLTSSYLGNNSGEIVNVGRWDTARGVCCSTSAGAGTCESGISNQTSERRAAQTGREAREAKVSADIKR
jgi:hypothetical protein